MKELIEIGWWAIQGYIGFQLVMPLIFYAAFCTKGRKRQPGQVAPSPEGDYAIIVTAYEQTHMLPSVVSSLLDLNHSNYHIYVVADKCDISALSFVDERVTLLRPEKVLASNTRSHFYAIDRFKRPHDRLTIIDSDNLVDTSYLKALDHFFAMGYEAVQGVRKAKNMNTIYARLDAARDIYYHFYDGKVLFGIGSSATLSGSGMAFTTELYKTCLQQTNVEGAGFDKVLQFEIVLRDKRIAFTENAIVYDEKTAHSDQLVKQRSRWINTWFKYARYGFSLLAKGIGDAKANQLVFGVVLLRPPLFLFLLAAMLCLVANVFMNGWVALLWLLGLLLFVAGFFLALASSNTDKRIYRSLRGIPAFVCYQVISLFMARRANKISVATKHQGHHKEEKLP